MELVFYYSLFVGAIFVIWLLYVIRQFHKLGKKEK